MGLAPADLKGENVYSTKLARLEEAAEEGQIEGVSAPPTQG
jgi:hypothetical protein